MSAEWTVLRDTVTHLVSAHAGGDARPPESGDRELWRELDELGFVGLAVPEELGGSGGSLVDAGIVLMAAAAAPCPLAEALFLAGPLMSAAGIERPGGITTAAFSTSVGLRELPSGLACSGELSRVPWVRWADQLVVLVDTDGHYRVAVVEVDGPGVVVRPGSNLAGEPRDDVTLANAPVVSVGSLPEGDWAGRFMALGATARALQMAGAAKEVLSLTTTYLSQRHQFGRALIDFQVLQHRLAQLAGDVVTIEVAALAAAHALESSEAPVPTRVIAAKAEASSLVRNVAASAHQAHGAIGFTMEHRLGALTKRLWAWREEFGNERAWNQTMAGRVMELSGGVWELVTTPDRPRDVTSANADKEMSQ